MLEHYLRDLFHDSKFTVPETGHYAILQRLLDAIGKPLKVHAIIHPQNIGVGLPDLGLFAENQMEGQKPQHGVIEAKPLVHNLDELIKSDQVNKYLKHYGQVLVTNFYQFALVTTNGVEERYSLAPNSAEFLKIPLKTLVAQHEDALREYLLRVMRRGAPLSDPRDVAWILASYAREAKARLAHGGTDLSALATVREQLEQALGLHFDPKTGDDFFRSTLVQTLFYGVFSAWVLWHESKPPSDARFNLWQHIRNLNVPAIQELFEQVTLPSRLRPLNIEEILNWTAEALNRVEPSFFERFQRGAAIQYFYEPFLEAFDPELRKQLGVWYTPPQVVEYMVARVDMALREELGIEDGLLNPQVYILDPCCGTGAYVVEVLRYIYQAAQARGEGAMAGQTVLEALSGAKSRIFGFEILPAPFVIAHLQIGMLLKEMQAPLPSGQRAGVYLTNALTGWDENQQLRLAFPELQKEHDASQKVKQQQPILVILGNPPYAGYAGIAIEEERELTNAYRTTTRAPKPQGQGLNDLYVRFFRMAERRIVEKTQRGVVCFISNYSWLDGLSHTGMRERYLEVFDSIFIDNLHGDRIISERTPDGASSETIFAMRGHSTGIKVGTAIATLVARHDHQEQANVYYRDFHQARAEERRQALLASIKDNPIPSPSPQAGKGIPVNPNPTVGTRYIVSAVTMRDGYQHLQPLLDLGLPLKPRDVTADYMTWAKLPDLFPTYFPGVTTSRDSMLVDIDRENLEQRIEAYFDKNISDQEITEIDASVMKSTNRFNAKETRDYLIKRGTQGKIVRYCYRPFDVRWLYWEGETKLLDEKRSEYVPHVQEDNFWIVAQAKARRDWDATQFIKQVGSYHLEERGARAFPLYLYDTPKTKQKGLFDTTPTRRPNLSQLAQDYLKRVGADETVLFYHALAVMHSPAYRTENAGALRQDWARIPLPASREALEQSAALGRRVAALLDVAAPVENRQPQTIAVLQTSAATPDFTLTGWGYLANGAVMPAGGKVSENGAGLDVYLNATTYWQNIPVEVWEYTLGGYQVLKKWLSYRDNRILQRAMKPEEVREFSGIARRIGALVGLSGDLDANYRGVV